MTVAVDACSAWSVDYPQLGLVLLAIRGLAPEISSPPRSAAMVASARSLRYCAPWMSDITQMISDPKSSQ
jgi:hypothetical protein